MQVLRVSGKIGQLNYKLRYKIGSSFYKSSENIQRKECGSDRSVINNQSSSVTLNELAMEARRYTNTVILSFSKEVIQ